MAARDRQRAMTVAELNAIKYNTHQMDGEWADLLGERIELSGVWFVWGGSNSGKTSFVLQAAAMLASHGRVLYNSVEEGLSYTIKLAVNRAGLAGIKNFLFVARESMDALAERLERPKSPNIVIIDSFQHARLSYDQVCDMAAKFPKKLFILTSHAKGKEPSGKDAEDTRYMADVKIRCEGYTAFAQSRYGGGNPYVIYAPLANEYWGHND